MSTLILVPTEGERRAVAGVLPGALLAGFGPIAAAARSAQLLAEHRPERALLVGIAGSYDLDSLPLGVALTFDAVAVDGIGAGEGAALLGPEDLGLAQWSDAERGDVGDGLPLDGPGGPLLLTVCAASASPEQAMLRRNRHPTALAEDMEGFAVALACHLLEVPLVIVRGISNLAGDRDVSSWRIDDALGAAAELAAELLEKST